MKIFFHSDLDAPRIPYSWDGEVSHLRENFDATQRFSPLPAIGATMLVPHFGYEVEMEVISHRYSQDPQGRWSVKVELHIPRHQQSSVIMWNEKMKRMKDNPMRRVDPR